MNVGWRRPLRKLAKTSKCYTGPGLNPETKYNCLYCCTALWCIRNFSSITSAWPFSRCSMSSFFPDCVIATDHLQLIDWDVESFPHGRRGTSKVSARKLRSWVISLPHSQLLLKISLLFLRILQLFSMLDDGTLRTERVPPDGTGGCKDSIMRCSPIVRSADSLMSNSWSLSAGSVGSRWSGDLSLGGVSVLSTAALPIAPDREALPLSHSLRGVRSRQNIPSRQQPLIRTRCVYSKGDCLSRLRSWSSNRVCSIGSRVFCLTWPTATLSLHKRPPV
jgi:hypothetical protein